MKKILSLFLASMMLLSLFTVAPVFAATSQATADGGTLWHKFDFEDGSAADKINGASTAGATQLPVIDSDGSGEFYGKFTAIAGKDIFLLNTTSTLGTNQDRYTIFEFDFKKDDTTYKEGTTTSPSPAVNFYIREGASNTQHSVFNYTKAEATDWVHTIVVIDKTPGIDGQYVSKSYSEIDGVYTLLKTVTVNAVAINSVRTSLNGTHNPNKNYYIDNFELKTYKNIYEAINAAQSAQTVQNIIDKYAGLNMANIPNEYFGLTASEKFSVAEKLLNKNFTSDSAVVSEILTILADEVFEKVYFDWDFEDGTINDSVNNEPFMTDNPSYGDEIVVAKDPVDGTNLVAKIDFSASTQPILIFTDIVDNAYAAGEFNYLTVDFKAYGDYDRNVSIYQDMRKKNGSTSDRFYTVHKPLLSKTWHQIKGVINVPEMKISAYELIDGNWNLINEEALVSTFGFYRIGIERAGNPCDFYYDDFRVTGYKSVVAEVNEASVNGVLDALEVSNENGIINLPAAYFAMDDSAKAVFAQNIKSKTYATADEIRDAIKIYFSTDDLVVLASANDSNGKLDFLKLYVKKDGVNLATSKFFVAAYADGELKGLASCPQTSAIATGSIVTLTGLAVDAVSASEVKVIFVNNLTDLTPVTKTTKIK